MLKGFASDTSSSHCWLACLLGWRVGSLCSTRITGLPRSYGPVRPCASHRYSAPHGSATWSSPLASRRQVPTFRTRASRWPHAVFMPVTTRTVGRHPPSFFPGQQLEPGFGDVPTLSTRHQRFTCVRLASAHLTGSPRLFRNAHHLGHWTKAACGGLDPDPAIRARGTCPHLLCSKAASSWLSLLHGSLLFAPSWRTIVGKTRVLDVGVLAGARSLLRPLQHPIQLIEVEIAEQWRDHSALRDASLTIGFEHDLQQVHHVGVVDPLCHLAQQTIMSNVVKIAAQVDVDHACLVLNDRSGHPINRFMRCPFGTISKRSWLEVGLKDWLQDELERTLHHPIPDRRT